jgi:hypothetical protein
MLENWRSTDVQPPRWLVVVVAIVAVVTSMAVTVQMVRVGHSGAAATWSGVSAGGGARAP